MPPYFLEITTPNKAQHTSLNHHQSNTLMPISAGASGQDQHVGVYAI
jgi:hypothetical protein